MARLVGRTALVIGAATGIGRAVCTAFAREGARVAVADHGHASEQADLVRALKEAGGEAFDVEVDVTDEAQVRAAVAASLSQFGRLDILVNNAGISPANGPFVELDWANWDRALAVNLKGVAFGMKAALPSMLEQGYGRIINTASQLAHKPAAFAAGYSASKAAVVALTASVAQEVANRGVTVNCVCPGPTDTPMWRANDPDWSLRKLAELPIRRIAEPGEIAGAFVYLASDEASYMIGQSVSPNGGDVMW